MNDRMIAMSAEQAEILDEIVIPQLMRDHDDQSASLMMGLALAWRFAAPSEPEIPSNVYPIVRHAGDSWSRRVGGMSGFDYNEWKRAWRRANADHYRKQARDYYAEKRETERARARARYAASADKNSDRYRNRDPEKVRARWSVQQAIRSGQLVREPCQECGSSENVHAHHEDYSRPLDVRWLCSICHGALHAAHRRTLA